LDIVLTSFQLDGVPGNLLDALARRNTTYSGPERPVKASSTLKH
jgi:hypothetical protein